MASPKKIIVVLLGLTAAGLTKMPFEQKFTEELREQRLAPPTLSLEAWTQMSQNGLAGAFGGLRSVLAFFKSLEAHLHFEDQEWYELKNDFKVVTSLDPYNAFYWDQGSHHLAYNAASWARSQRDQPEIKRISIEKEYLEAGDTFLRNGLRYLPEDADLWAAIGRIWSHPLKRPDIPRAVEAWKKAAALSNNHVYERNYFLSLAKIPGREKEALDVALELVEVYPRNLTIPTFRCVLWSLYQNPQLPLDLKKPTMVQLFGSKKRAYRDLHSYWYRINDDGFYAGNVGADLHQLVIDLNVPFEFNPFLSPRQRRIPRSWWQD